MIYDVPCSLSGASFAHLPIYGLEGLGLCRAARPAPLLPSATPPAAFPGRPAGLAARGSRSTPMAAASPTYIPARTHCRRACARCAAPPRPSPGCQDLGLPRCRRHVRRVGHDHHVERAAVSRSERHSLNVDEKGLNAVAKRS
jgi:hypothetical protein